MNKLLKIIRDPVWQMVGVIVGAITLFVALSQTDTGPREIAIIHTNQMRMINSWLPGDRFKLLFSGATYDIGRAVVDYYVIVNESNKSIRPSDFVDPVKVESGSDKIRLVSVESCAKQHAQSCSPQGKDLDLYVATTWKAAGTNWVAENPHLNARNSACVIVVSEHDQLSLDTREVRLPKWAGRVADYRIRVFDSLREYERTRERRWVEYAYTTVHLEGVGIYWFVLLVTSILFASVSLGSRSAWADVSSAEGISRCVLLALASITTSEILIDIFVNRRDTEALHPIVWPLLVAHLCLLLYLAVRAFRSRNRTTLPPPRSPE